MESSGVRGAPAPGRARGPVAGSAPPQTPEWAGTGLCAEAQADGVPCQESGRSCDVCVRRLPARVLPLEPQSFRKHHSLVKGTLPI
jgi:hypothetical protein